MAGAVKFVPAFFSVQMLNYHRTGAETTMPGSLDLGIDLFIPSTFALAKARNARATGWFTCESKKTSIAPCNPLSG